MALIEIDGLPINSMVIFHGELLNNQRVMGMLLENGSHFPIFHKSSGFPNHVQNFRSGDASQIRQIRWCYQLFPSSFLKILHEVLFRFPRIFHGIFPAFFPRFPHHFPTMSRLLHWPSRGENPQVGPWRVAAFCQAPGVSRQLQRLGQGQHRSMDIQKTLWKMIF